MSDWQPISSAPKRDNYSRKEIQKIDILAKTWLRDEDQFTFRRFTDCYWDLGDSMRNRKAGWKGVDPDWLPVAWMPLPVIPKEWP